MARMITCEGSCTYRSKPRRQRSPLRRRQRAIHRRARRHAGLRLQRARHPRRLSGDRRRVRRLSARDPLRAEGQLDAGARAPAALARQPRRRQLRRRDRRWRCAPGSSRKDIVFTGVGKTRDELEFAIAKGVGTINAESAGELDRIARSRAAWAAWRASRCASIPTSTRRATRTSPPASRATSSACRCRTRAPSIASAAALAGLQFVGVHVHIGSQITTAEPLQRAAEALVVAGDRAARGRLRRSSTSISAAASASPTKGGR